MAPARERRSARLPELAKPEKTYGAPAAGSSTVNCAVSRATMGGQRFPLDARAWACEEGGAGGRKRLKLGNLQVPLPAPPTTYGDELRTAEAFAASGDRSHSLQHVLNALAPRTEPRRVAVPPL